MSITQFLQGSGKHLGLVINGLFCLLITIASTIYFNTAPPPSNTARLGTVVVDLDQLGYQLKYEHLQKAGMFDDRGCKDCDLSKGAKDHRYEEFRNQEFMGSLYRSRGELWLHFYGKDPSIGKERFEQSLNALRAQFPDRGAAITKWKSDSPENAQIGMDLLIGARTSARVEENLVRILEEEGFRLAWQRKNLKAGIEKLTVLGLLQHSELTFVKGQLRYWPRRPQFEASLFALLRDMPAQTSDEEARQLLSRLKERLVAEYGHGRVKVRTSIQ